MPGGVGAGAFVAALGCWDEPFNLAKCVSRALKNVCPQLGCAVRGSSHATLN